MTNGIEKRSRAGCGAVWGEREEGGGSWEEEEGPLRSGVAADSAERGRPSRRVINFEAGDGRGDKQVEAGI